MRSVYKQGRLTLYAVDARAFGTTVYRKGEAEAAPGKRVRAGRIASRSAQGSTYADGICRERTFHAELIVDLLWMTRTILFGLSSSVKSTEVDRN